MPSGHCDVGYGKAMSLSPTKALIFRIVHRDNLPWILDNGLHAANGEKRDPNFRCIGNPELIDKRSSRIVPVGPGGRLSDYVAFYFTPFSIMMYNIKTGYGGIVRVPNQEIVILVSSLVRIAELGIPFVFTDRHAYVQMANYYTDLNRLDEIDWPLLNGRDFRNDPDDPAKKERYQAEALVWKYVPLRAIMGIGCYTSVVKSWVENHLQQRDLELRTTVQANWYF
jgi:hypothetical protein